MFCGTERVLLVLVKLFYFGCLDKHFISGKEFGICFVMFAKLTMCRVSEAKSCLNLNYQNFTSQKLYIYKLKTIIGLNFSLLNLHFWSRFFFLDFWDTLFQNFLRHYAFWIRPLIFLLISSKLILSSVLIFYIFLVSKYTKEEWKRTSPIILNPVFQHLLWIALISSTVTDSITTIDSIRPFTILSGLPSLKEALYEIWGSTARRSNWTW